LADPPWRFIKYSEVDQSRSPENHYDVMSLDDIKNLPVAKHANDDCVLLLWATDPLLEKAFEVIKAWNFTYKTVGFYWTKQNIKSPTFFTGMGYWTRANPEQCLLATRGHPQRKAKDVPRLIVAPRREHSRKPDEAINRI
jgi:N6-adenosine-specific RNA methylase IME4